MARTAFIFNTDVIVVWSRASSAPFFTNITQAHLNQAKKELSTYRYANSIQLTDILWLMETQAGHSIVELIHPERLSKEIAIDDKPPDA